jgi:hypothetical protein
MGDPGQVPRRGGSRSVLLEGRKGINIAYSSSRSTRTPGRGGPECLRDTGGIGFVQQDGHERRSVDDHQAGSPCSS